MHFLVPPSPHRSFNYICSFMPRSIPSGQLFKFLIGPVLLGREVEEGGHADDQVGDEEHADEAGDHAEKAAEVGLRVDVAIAYGGHSDDY